MANTPGLVGNIQAAETIKLIMGIGETLAGYLLLMDGLHMEFREVTILRTPLGSTATARGLQSSSMLSSCAVSPVTGRARLERR